jgi:RimJ/RimL family protein N-acetyltransferase
LITTPEEIKEFTDSPVVYFYNRLKSKITGKGGGSKALKMTLDFIDDVRIPLINTVNAYGMMNHDQLVAFYKRHGFTAHSVRGEDLLIYFPKIDRENSNV